MGHRRAPLPAPGKADRPFVPVPFFVNLDTGEILGGLFFGGRPRVFCNYCKERFHRIDIKRGLDAPHVPEDVRGKPYCTIRCLEAHLIKLLTPQTS